MAAQRHELSEFDRGRIVGAHDAGMSERAIGEMYGFPKSTVHDIIKAFDEEGLTHARPRSGRPLILDDRDRCHLVRNVNKDHYASLADITAEIEDLTLDPVSVLTVRRALHLEGYHGRVGVRKPPVSNKNRLVRQKWAKERLAWEDEWNFIIWSDESKFELTGGNRRKWVWRRPDQKMDVDCLVPTVKTGDKSVMVWGCFTRFGVGPLVRVEGRLNAKGYVKILETHFRPFLESFDNKEGFTFQQDNAPIHTAKKTTQWLAENTIPSLPWPAQSPDINPIEHLWDELERRIRGLKKRPKTEDELFQFLQEEWVKIPLSVLKKLVDSMPKRVVAVREANGNPTRY